MKKTNNIIRFASITFVALFLVLSLVGKTARVATFSNQAQDVGPQDIYSGVPENNPELA